MNIELVPVLLQILAGLAQPYLHELSGFADHIRFRKNGQYAVAYFDKYWKESGWHPYSIYADDKLAGFLLVNTHNMRTPGARSIAEFFILHEFRRHGIGYHAAHLAFDYFPGLWEIRVLEKNRAALYFWQKCIKSKIVYMEECLENGRYVFSFYFPII